MTDIFDAGSDDEAIAGEHVGYVPCTDEAFAGDADDDSEAIDGSDAGYVADGTEAGDFVDSDDGQAVYGSAVGFVAKPCCTDGIIDDAERTEVFAPFNAWGRTTPDSYGVWNTGSPTGSSSFSVNGHQLVAVGGHATPLGTPRGTTAVLSGSFPTGPWPWEDGDFNVRIRIQFDAIGIGGTPAISFDFGSGGWVHMYIEHGPLSDGPDGGQNIGIGRTLPSSGAAVETPIDSLTLDAWYLFDMEYRQSTGLHRARFYLESGAVPDWQLSRDSSGDPATVSSGMRVVSQPADSSPDTTYLIDYILYDLCDLAAD